MSGAKIIGGEFKISSEMLAGECHNDFTPSYSIGRTCLYAILQEIYGKEVTDDRALNVEKSKKRGVLLPDYICISVAEVPHRLGIPIRHYHVKSNFLPNFDSIKENILGCDSIILISYFGLVDLDDTVKELRTEFPSLKIIIDDVQNYYGFGKHIDFDYCFSSYRKWFCTPDGADIVQKFGTPSLEHYSHEPRYIHYKVAGNLLKNYSEWIEDDVALELISKGEEMMDEGYLFGCSVIGRELFKRLDFSDVQEIRRRNATYLHEGLVRLGIDHLYNVDSTPLFIPINISKRDELRKNLFLQHIFAPVHWPIADSFLQGDNELYRTELSLICDQRYDEEDMERIIQGIENAM